MEMADPMGCRNRGQRAQRRIRLRMLRCGQNVDHVGFRPRLDVTARQGPPKFTGCRLFVHEYRCMAALANGAGFLNSEDKGEGCENDLIWPSMFQSRSGCLFPRETAPRRGRRSRSWGCRGTWWRSAIPVHIVSRGSRGLSISFIVVLPCETIRPGFLPS